MKPYHNKGFGWAFFWIVTMGLVFPSIIMLSIDDGFAKFWKMRGGTGDCWENSKHERVCKDNNTCLIGRNFCIPEKYRWRAD